MTVITPDDTDDSSARYGHDKAALRARPAPARAGTSAWRGPTCSRRAASTAGREAVRPADEQRHVATLAHVPVEPGLASCFVVISLPRSSSATTCSSR